MQIDDLPVGQSKKNFMVEEYPPGTTRLQLLDFDPQQQEKVDLPLKQRVKSKVWKVRLQAFEELMDDPELDCECIISIIQDNHVQCQEKALQIAQLFFEKHTALEVGQQKELYKILLEKVLTQPKLKQLGNSLATLLFPHSRSAIFEMIISQLQHKNPKVVQATIALLIELLQQFGLKKLENLKPFFPIMSKLTEAQLSTIKADAIAFFKETTKWYGKNIEAFFGGLNEKLQQDLKKLAESVTEVLKAPNQEEEANTAKQELYDLVEAVEVFNKFSDTWCERVFQLEKWQEKKEQLEILHKACSVQKILPSQHIYSVVQLLKKLINEQNITISTYCIKIVGCISSGLRKNFNQYAKILMLPVLNKLKDKKQMIVDDTIATVKKMFYCCSLDEFFEDFKALLEDKAPSPKINVFIIIEFYLDENSKEKINKQQCIKSLIPICKKFAEDGNLDVRVKSVNLLAKISAKLFNGSLSTDFKGDKFTKYQAQVQSCLEGLKVTQGNQQQDMQQPQPLTVKQLQQQIVKPITPPQPNCGQIIIEQSQDQMKYSPNMTPSQVDQYLKNFKLSNKYSIEFGNTLLQVSQTSKFIQSTISEFIVEKIGEHKQLCQLLFEKSAQNYTPNHISSLIQAFKNAQTQSSLIEILNLLLKHIPQCDKTLDQQLISDFLKIYQHQSNLKTRSLVQDCQNALKAIFEQKKTLQSDQQQQLSPFPFHCFNDQHFEKLKDQLKVPQIPQALFEKLFSYNIQQNIAAASYIKMKVASPGEFSELFFKWAYMIAWMKENIPLQTEIAQLLQMLITQHKPTQLEQQVTFSYIKMMSLLYFKNGMPKLAQRTLPLLMNLLADCKRMGLQSSVLPLIEDFDEMSNQQANEFMKLMWDNAQEWSINNTMQQKQIIASMLGIISKEESIILNKPSIQVSQQQPQAQILSKLVNNENSGQKLNQIDLKLNQTMVELQKIEQKNQENRILMPAVLSNQNLSNANKILTVQSYQMELEQDQFLRIFQQMYQLFRETDNVADPPLFADQILLLLQNLLKEQQYDKINSFLEKLAVVLSKIEFLRAIPYDKFYQIFDLLFLKMIEEANKPVKEGLNKNYYSLLNLNLIKILNNQELSLLYLAFLDLLIKVKETGCQSKQFYQLLTKCLRRSLESLKGQFQWQQFQQILERINSYLNLCANSISNPEFQEFENFVLSALRSTVTFLLHYNDGIKVYQIIMNMTTEKSILRQWLLEFSETSQVHSDLSKYRRSRDININQIIDLLKIDFEKTVEQFVSIIRRQNINWKPLVSFLNQQQIAFIGMRLEQTSHMNNLERKVGELEKMLNQ